MICFQKIFSPLTFALILVSGISQAGINTYECEILQAVQLSDDGHIVEHNGIWKARIGKSFTVNRQTGEMIGLPFTTEGWVGGVKILNRGDSEESYKAIVSSGGPHRSIMFIHIEEFKDSARKPFWGNGDDAVIFSGLCE